MSVQRLLKMIWGTSSHCTLLGAVKCVMIRLLTVVMHTDCAPSEQAAGQANLALVWGLQPVWPVARVQRLSQAALLQPCLPRGSLAYASKRLQSCRYRHHIALSAASWRGAHARLLVYKDASICWLLCRGIVHHWACKPSPSMVPAANTSASLPCSGRHMLQQPMLCMFSLQCVWRRLQ